GILFRHSVEQTPVLEWFEPAGDGDGLLVVAAESRPYGAGLPTEAPPGARRVRLPDRLRLQGPAAPAGALDPRRPPLPAPAPRVGGEAYDLTQWAGPDGRLRVRVLAAGLVRKDDEEEGRS